MIQESMVTIYIALQRLLIRISAPEVRILQSDIYQIPRPCHPVLWLICYPDQIPDCRIQSELQEEPVKFT